MKHLRDTWHWVKDLLTLPSPTEMMKVELLEAQRQKLREESLREYSTAMVMYNNDRILRLTSYLESSNTNETFNS
jgi:hypothetical protein